MVPQCSAFPDYTALASADGGLGEGWNLDGRSVLDPRLCQSIRRNAVDRAWEDDVRLGISCEVSALHQFISMTV